MEIELDKINTECLLLLVKEGEKFEIQTFTVEENYGKEKAIYRSLLNNYTEEGFQKLILFIELRLFAGVDSEGLRFWAEEFYDSNPGGISFKSFMNTLYTQKEKIFNNRRKDVVYNEHLKTTDDLKMELYELIKRNIPKVFESLNFKIAIKKAKSENNVIDYSHTLKRWFWRDKSISENLKFRIDTNFGYGSKSYFYMTLKYKDIPITTSSDWVNYGNSFDSDKFSEVIRHTEKFISSRDRVNSKKGNKKSKKTLFQDSWYSAFSYLKEAGDLILEDEEQFIKVYITDKCENMVSFLEGIYKLSIDDLKEYYKKENIQNENLSINGYYLNTFKSEKIIGGLTFLDMLMKYDNIIQTKGYKDRILDISTAFTPIIENCLNDEKKLLKETEVILREFSDSNQKLSEEYFSYNEDFYQNGSNDSIKEFSKVEKKYRTYSSSLDKLKRKVSMHDYNVKYLERQSQTIYRLIGKHKSK